MDTEGEPTRKKTVCLRTRREEDLKTDRRRRRHRRAALRPILPYTWNDIANAIRLGDDLPCPPAPVRARASN